MHWDTLRRRVIGSSVAKYGAASLVPRGTAIITVLTVTPLVISRLGVIPYGYWMLATLIPTVVAAPDLGLTQGLINETSAVHRRDGNLRREASRLFGLERVLRWIAATWLVGGCVVAALYTGLARSGDRESGTTLFWCLVLSLLCFTASIPAILWSRAQLAQEMGHRSVLWEGVGKVASLVASLIVLFTWPNVFLLVLAYMLPPTLSAWCNASQFIRVELGGRPPTIPGVRRTLSESRAIFSSGRYFLVFQVCFLVGSSLDPFLVNWFLSTVSFSYLSIARRPFDMLPLVVTLFGASLWPVFSRLQDQGRIALLQRTVLSTSLWASGFVLCSGIFLALASGPVYQYLGQGHISVQFADLIWLTLQTMAVTIGVILSLFLNAMSRLRAQAWILVASTLFSIALKYWTIATLDIHAYIAVAALLYLLTNTLPMGILASHVFRELK